MQKVEQRREQLPRGRGGLRPARLPGKKDRVLIRPLSLTLPRPRRGDGGRVGMKSTRYSIWIPIGQSAVAWWQLAGA
jgi:hypothetical protein